MCFPAALVDRAWPPWAGLWQQVGAHSRPMAQLFCWRWPPGSRLAGEGDLLPAQSSLAWPGFVLQLQPTFPSGLLSVLAQLTPMLGTKETWVASGRNITVPVMPTRSGVVLTLDSKQTVLCSLSHLQEGVTSCPITSGAGWGHMATQAWQQRPCVHHPERAGSQCRRERSSAPSKGSRCCSPPQGAEDPGKPEHRDTLRQHRGFMVFIDQA